MAKRNHAMFLRLSITRSYGVSFRPVLTQRGTLSYCARAIQVLRLRQNSVGDAPNIQSNLVCTPCTAQQKIVRKMRRPRRTGATSLRLWRTSGAFRLGPSLVTTPRIKQPKPTRTT